MNTFLPVPDHWPPRKRPGYRIACDMIAGPCLCGDVHTIEEPWVLENLKKYGLYTEKPPLNGTPKVA